MPGKLGMALCDGYDSMGIAMSKPNLRADLENDLKLICDGVKSKEEVLADQIAKYRQIFVISMENVNNLDAATQHFMNEAPAVNENELGMNGDVTGNVQILVKLLHYNKVISIRSGYLFRDSVNVYNFLAYELTLKFRFRYYKIGQRVI